MDVKKTLLKLKTKYFIVDIDKYESETELLDKIADVLNKGADFIHIKSASPRDLINYGFKIRELCSHFNSLFIIEDRIDALKLLSADGIYLNSKSIPTVYAKKLLENDILIGTYDLSGDYTLASNAENSDISVYSAVFV